MMTNFRPLWILALNVLILSGCATVEPSTTNVEWDTHQQRLDTITQYSSNGKLGYIAPDQRQSLNFQWKHSPLTKQLRLTTFLGQTALNLNITPQGAMVETYDNGTYSSKDADSLIYQLTGLTIPVDQLSNWLLGDPTGADAYQLNDTNTVATLNKSIDGQLWQLEYIEYTDIQYSGVALPLPKSSNSSKTISRLILSLPSGI